jgi:RimJ/RimL family protein N-acetyltransferase
MIHELEPAQYDRAVSLFEGAKRHVPAMAILHHAFPGRVFVDDPGEPRAALAWALTRWAYIAGDAASALVELLPDLVDRIVIPDSRRLGQDWFELYCQDDPVWIARLAAALTTYRPEQHFELLLVLDPERWRASSDPTRAPGVHVQRVDVPILPPRALDSPLIDEAFRRRTAVGFACLVGESQVAVCRSNGFAAGREFMVDVETPEPEHRGKGYASIASHALVDYSLRQGYSPLWETVEDNEPSLRLARRLGYVERERYPVYAIEF